MKRLFFVLVFVAVGLCGVVAQDSVKVDMSGVMTLSEFHKGMGQLY